MTNCWLFVIALTLLVVKTHHHGTFANQKASVLCHFHCGMSGKNMSEDMPVCEEGPPAPLDATVEIEEKTLLAIIMKLL